MTKSFFAFILNLFKSRAQLQLENLFLRKQLEILSRPIEPIGKIAQVPILNGLHNIYFREAV